MKFLLNPFVLILLVIVLAIIFMPRRAPDAAKKLRKPMRAFPDEPTQPPSSADKSPDEPHKQ